MRRLGPAAVVFLLACAPAAAASSLPKVESGERPGPPLLYEDAPKAPPLSLDAPFRAKPLLVSGTDAYRDGEYLYQDYLFDDHGADTLPGPGNQEKPGPGNFSAAAGDVAYPTDSRFAANAADLVELRIKPKRGAIVYRVTLNTVKDEDAAAVGIGIDTDREGGGQVDWPGDAGVSSPGLDRFITAWGTGGRVTRLPGGGSDPLPDGAVEIDNRTNQMTIRVSRDVMDPRSREWRYVAGAGLRQGNGLAGVEPGAQPQEDESTSGGPGDAPGIFNLAFRFDEPQTSRPTPPFTTFPGVGNFFEDRQSRALADGTTGGFRADVDFGRLEDGADRDLHEPDGREQARIFPSSLDLHEGVKEEFPEFGGQLQPYLLTVPPGYRRSDPAGLTFSLHSLGGTYTQYKVFSPTQLRQFGDDRDDLVATPLGRGPDGWYTDEGETDFFEVWADVARNFELDSERVALTGYSMGGYGTYKLGVEYPDLFGKAFTTVGPPGLGIWIPPAPPQPGGEVSNTNHLLENVRWVPYLNWVGQQDQLVPIVGPEAQQQRFDDLGLRSVLERFQGEHFTLAILDEWGAARDFLGGSRVERDPSRVNYAFFPEADVRRLDLVHDHAYWVSNLRARDDTGDPQTDPARGEIDALSQAFGEGDPRTETISEPRGGSGRPSPSVATGTEWTGIDDRPKRNRMKLDLDNVRRATIDGQRGKLDGDEPLRVRIESDGDGEMRLDVPLPGDAVARRIDGPPLSATGAGGQSAPEVELDRDGATIEVGEGTREYLITTAGDSEGSGTGGKGFSRERPPDL